MKENQSSEPGIRWLPLVLGVILLLGAAGGLLAVFFAEEIFPEYSPSHRGQLLAVEGGCLACHAPVTGPRPLNPKLGSAVEDFRPIPSFSHERMPTAEIEQWIRNGISEEEARSETHLKAREQKLLTMPAYGEQFSDGEIEDLVSFVALAQYQEAAETAGFATPAEDLARRYGCFTCHGEMGQGGVENPGSLKGYIPGFFGTDFRALTRNGDRQDIEEWIRDGSSEFFSNQGFAGFHPGRYFSERQAIEMPAYGELLEDEEIDLLVDFLIQLMETGPLTADELLELRPIAPAGTTEANPAPEPE